MKARQYYQCLIHFQKIWLVCAFVSVANFAEDPKYLFIFVLLHAGTIAGKINILLEAKCEADPDFWEMYTPD